MSSLLLRQQVGQLMIIGLHGLEMDEHLRSFFYEIQPGGVIFFKRNIGSAPQCYDFLQECRRVVSVPLFTCVDLEGGTVDRMRDIVCNTHSAAQVAATKDRKLFRRAGEILGQEARAFGFNTNFAPVSDLGLPPSRSVLGSRTASEDAATTVAYVKEFMRGLDSAGVLGCGKHYPGLGEASLDSHLTMPVIKKPWKKMWVEDLLPYRKLHKQFPFIMTAHADYPDVTKGGTPASISKKWLTDILKKKIGYRGIILADDLEMGGVLAAASIQDAALMTMRAGSDMFLVCHKEEDVHAVFDAVLHEAERDKKFAALVQKAAEHVLRFKAKLKALKKVAPRPNDKTVAKLRAALERFDKQLIKAAKH
jgi:beta-N-acetylhexosaminidase